MAVEWIPYIGTFMGGAITGATAKYLADKFTDQRRNQEAHKQAAKEFKNIKKSMLKLISEIKEDLSGEENKFRREFFIIARGVKLNIQGNYLLYYREDHEDLQGQMSILENHGYIIDVTSGNTPKYRMTEEFVELVRKYG